MVSGLRDIIQCKDNNLNVHLMIVLIGENHLLVAFIAFVGVIIILSEG